MIEKKMMVLYHAECVDGFTAAWVARGLYLERDVEYIPVKYFEPPPDVTGKEVLILDFSYPRGVLEEMYAKAAKLLVLDHHATAQEALAGLPYAEFDMERSGAGMTWDRLYASSRGVKRKWLVDYVEDRDLWRFKLPGSKEVSAYLSSQPMTFESWSRISEMDVNLVAELGTVLLASIDESVRALAKNARTIDFCGK